MVYSYIINISFQRLPCYVSSFVYVILGQCFKSRRSNCGSHPVTPQLPCLRLDRRQGWTSTPPSRSRRTRTWKQGRMVHGEVPHLCSAGLEVGLCWGFLGFYQGSTRVLPRYSWIKHHGYKSKWVWTAGKLAATTCQSGKHAGKQSLQYYNFWAPPF